MSDLKAHSASQRDVLWACRSATFVKEIGVEVKEKKEKEKKEELA